MLQTDPWREIQPCVLGIVEDTGPQMLKIESDFSTNAEERGYTVQARPFDDHALDVTPILWCVNPLQVMHRFAQIFDTSLCITCKGFTHHSTG